MALSLFLSPLLEDSLLPPLLRAVAGRLNLVYRHHQRCGHLQTLLQPRMLEILVALNHPLQVILALAAAVDQALTQTVIQTMMALQIIGLQGCLNPAPALQMGRQISQTRPIPRIMDCLKAI